MEVTKVKIKTELFNDNFKITSVMEYQKTASDSRHPI